MKRIYICAVLFPMLALAGCVFPVPHRRLHQFGVSGRILDSYSHAPVNAAQVAAGEVIAFSNSDGSFTVAPVYGWHGAYALGGVGVSLLPGFDVPSPFREITLTAHGYQSSNIAAKTGSTSDAYIQVGDILLKRR